MASLNQVQIMGNLTRDAEVRNTASGKKVTSVTIAVNGRNGSADYFDLVAFDKTAEVLANAVKGTSLHVSARLKNNTYEKDGQKRRSNDIIISSFQYLSGRKAGEVHGSEVSELEDSIA